MQRPKQVSGLYQSELETVEKTMHNYHFLHFRNPILPAWGDECSRHVASAVDV